MPDQPDASTSAQQPAMPAVGETPQEASNYLRTGYRGNLCRIVKRTYLMSPPKILDAGELDDIPDEDPGFIAAAKVESA